MPTLSFASSSRRRLVVALLTAILLVPVAHAGAQAPANDDCDTPTVVNTLPFNTTVDTTNATTAPPVCTAGTNGGASCTTDSECPGSACQSPDPVNGCTFLRHVHSVWYAFTATSDGVLTANTFGTSFNTVLSAYTGTCSNLTEIACNNGGASRRSPFPSARAPRI